MPLPMLPLLDAPLPPIFPVRCHVASHCTTTVVLPLVAPSSCLPWLVVASPLVTPPLPLNVPVAASQRVITSPCAGASNSRLPFVKPPAGFSFGCWTPADEWMKMGALLGFWSVGVLGATPLLPPPEIESRINNMFVIHKHKIDFVNGTLCVTNTYHLYVFMIYKHKINLGNAPITHHRV
jgi:hypothetical protein